MSHKRVDSEKVVENDLLNPQAISISSLISLAYLLTNDFYLKKPDKSTHPSPG